MQAKQDQTGLIQVKAIGNPTQMLADLRKSINEWDSYWAGFIKTAESQGAVEAPAAQEALQIRGLFNNLLLPRLDILSGNSSENLGLFLNLMVPFDSAGGVRDFLLHFFQLEEGPNNKLVYKERDPYERDVYVLYDLYRVKKTMDVVSILHESLKNPERTFPSMFSNRDIHQILSSLNLVMKLLFTQCLSEKNRKEIIPQLSPKFLQGQSLLERREKEILYTYPHVLKKYDYRRFFFLVYFKNGLKARIGDEDREFRYNFLKFQVLKHEFMVHWLTGPLKNDPRKYEIYKKYALHGKTLLELIVEDPNNESAILQQMPSHTLNDMASQVSDAVPAELKVGVVPESKNFGFYHQLKEQLVSAVDMVRAPIELLRKKVETEEPEEIIEPARPGEVPKPAPEPAPAPEPTPEPTPDVEPRWEILLLKKNQLGKHFFQDTTTNFQTNLNALKAKLGPHRKEFSDYVTKLLENAPEIRTVRRRTPKHEWSMSYRLRYITPQETIEYLLILGAEVRSKPRGMGYQSKEAYSFFPYYVFATDSEEEGFGESTGERVAMGNHLKEYSFKMSAVAKKVMELLGIIQDKNK